MIAIETPMAFLDLMRLSWLYPERSFGSQQQDKAVLWAGAIDKPRQSFPLGKGFINRWDQLYRSIDA